MLMYMVNQLMALKKDNDGQGMVEYALLIGLIAVVVIAILLVLGPAIVAQYQAIIDKL